MTFDSPQAKLCRRMASGSASHARIDFQAQATKWAKETPLAPIFDAQIEYGKKFVERSANAARSLWRIE